MASAKVEQNFPPPQNSEFNVGRDDFAQVRKRSMALWIFKHLSYKQNKYVIILWFLLICIANYLYSLIRVLIGEGIDILIEQPNDLFLPVIIMIGVVSILSALFDLSANFTREVLAQRLERDTRQEFYLNLLGKSQSFHDEQRLGDLMARATHDVRQLNFLISPAISLIFDAFLNIIIPIAFILALFPAQLVLLPLSFTVLFIIALNGYVKKLGPVTQQMQIEFGNLTANLNESLAGIEIIKGMTNEKQSLRKYKKIAMKYYTLGVEEGRIRAKYIPILMIAVTITLSLAHAIILYTQGTYSDFKIGDIIAFVFLVGNLQFPTHISIWAFGIVKRASAGSQRLLEIMNKETEILENASPQVHDIIGQIVFDKVSFSYPGTSNPILKHVSFEVSPGQTVAIVGTTGSGKTTLTKLISRLYDINDGEITVDGINIQDFQLQSLRSQIAYIEQDLFLFSNSISENIAFGQQASKEEIIKAAKDAQAHDFIMELPNQYDSEVGERGVQLSGGERQRIAIARAFLSNPRVLILDDSTSAIDSRTEEEIQKAISQILHGRTTLIITHRLSQIRWADKILVMKQGRIIAQGDHFTLLKTSEEYRKIFVSRFDKTLEDLLEGQ
jgi:ATP-binding cassette subfamily B protein